MRETKIKGGKPLSELEIVLNHRENRGTYIYSVKTAIVF